MSNADLFAPHPRTFLRRIVSGGQTGADRAALDAAIAVGIPHGGWVPCGRWAEDGPLPRRYRMKETPTRYVALRTDWNVRDTDATVIFSHGKLTGGSALTHRLARKYKKPVLHVDFKGRSTVKALRLLRHWLDDVRPGTLNIAGPRASKDPRIYKRVHQVLSTLLQP
jgi:hypothetical protein